MYTWNDIVILGDGFCSERKTPNQWPYRLVNLITGEDPGPTKPVKGVGVIGAAWWAVKKQLAFHLRSNPKVLIVCHTDPMFLASNRHKPLNPSYASVERLETDFDSGLYRAVRHYYEHLFCEEFHLWAQTQWFKELEEIIEQTPSIEQVYHLNSVQGVWNTYAFRTGVTFKDNLSNYRHVATTEQRYDNNLTPTDNHRLAQQLAELINNYPGHGHVVNKFNLRDKHND